MTKKRARLAPQEAADRGHRRCSAVDCGMEFKPANARGDAPSVAAHLSLVPSVPDDAPADDLVQAVCVARRDVARLLRALQASGRSVAGWPNDMVTRLAHLDAVTVRHVIDPTATDETEVRHAVAAMRTVERWIVGRLSKAELAGVHEFALMISVSEIELRDPLLRPDTAPEDNTPRICVGAGPRPHSLRAGLASLDDSSLSGLCTRLGIRPLEIESNGDELGRGAMEAAIQETLRDDHLLSILVATLSPRTHQLLAALLRGEVDATRLGVTQAGGVQAAAAGGGVFTYSSPLEHLLACGLAFWDHPDTANNLWVPAELQHRLDGVLRTFGV